MKAYIYCTKAKPYLHNLNGTVVASFDLNIIEEIFSEKIDVGVGYEPLFYTERIDDIAKGSCLTQFEIENYLGCKKGGEVVGYAWHINNLEIFDKPVELSDFYTKVTDKDRLNCFKGLNTIIPSVRISKFTSEVAHCKKLEKAPQSWQQIIFLNKETNEYEYAILISIKPKWVCKILNGEKTIEVRKTYPKEIDFERERLQVIEK